MFLNSHPQNSTGEDQSEDLQAMKLKDLIKAVRGSKTAAEERAIISKESARLRTSLKDDSSDKYSNVAKLIYIYLLGYPAHFGQLECLKLIASPKYSHKRLGYLGVMVLLDETQELLTLVTNSLKKHRPP